MRRVIVLWEGEPSVQAEDRGALVENKTNKCVLFFLNGFGFKVCKYVVVIICKFQWRVYLTLEFLTHSIFVILLSD